MSTKCPKCHMENPAESKSCVHCGLLLDAVDKIPTYHPDTEETKTVIQTVEDAESEASTPEQPEPEVSESQSFFSGLRGIFRKKKM